MRYSKERWKNEPKEISPMNNWLLINSFAPWLSAFGTLCAVIVSLYLALRNEQERLKLTITYRDLSTDIDNKEVLWINVANIGKLPISIEKIVLSPFPDSEFDLKPTNMTISDSIPITLQAYQAANYQILIDDFHFTPVWNNVRKSLVENRRTIFHWKICRWFLPLRTRICVFTCTGKIIRKPLLKWTLLCFIKDQVI